MSRTEPDPTDYYGQKCLSFDQESDIMRHSLWIRQSAHAENGVCSAIVLAWYKVIRGLLPVHLYPSRAPLLSTIDWNDFLATLKDPLMQYYLEQQMRKQKTAYHLAGIRYAESNLRQTMADHEQEIEPFYKMIRDRAPAETAALRLDPRDYAHEAGPLSYTDYTNWAKRILEKLQIFLRLAPTYLESEHKQDLITSVQSILDYKKAFFETDAKTYIGVNSIEPSTWARQSDLVANLEHHIPALSAESIVYSTGTMLPLVQKSYYMCYILEAISNLTPIGFASVSTTNLDQDPATAKLNLTVMPLGRPGIRFYYMHLYGTTVAHIIGIITHTTSRGRQEVLFFDPNYGVYSFSCVGAHTPPKKPITTFLKEFVTVHKYPGIYTDATVHSFECN